MNRRACEPPSASRLSKVRGFSLVEVLVALVVVSVGLLGLAKMEAVGLSSTTVAGTRSVVAFQAANLAAMMHANQDFWQNSAIAAYPSITISSATNPFSTAPACTVSGSTACAPQAMAFADLNLWATSLALVLPVYSATITCQQNPPGTPSAPYACVIQITWPENAVAMNTQQTQGSIANLAGPTYTLYVQP